MPKQLDVRPPQQAPTEAQKRANLRRHAVSRASSVRVGSGHTMGDVERLSLSANAPSVGSTRTAKEVLDSEKVGMFAARRKVGQTMDSLGARAILAKNDRGAASKEVVGGIPIIGGVATKFMEAHDHHSRAKRLAVLEGAAEHRSRTQDVIHDRSQGQRAKRNRALVGGVGSVATRAIGGAVAPGLSDFLGGVVGSGVTSAFEQVSSDAFESGVGGGAGAALGAGLGQATSRAFSTKRAEEVSAAYRGQNPRPLAPGEREASRRLVRSLQQEDARLKKGEVVPFSHVPAEVLERSAAIEHGDVRSQAWDDGSKMAQARGDVTLKGRSGQGSRDGAPLTLEDIDD